MKKWIFISLIIITCLFLLNCAAWKKTLVSQGTVDDAIHNAIIDFINTTKQGEEYNVFGVSVASMDSTLLIVGIAVADNKIYPTPKNQVGTYDNIFPTKYIINDNKLFYWNDTTQVISQDIIDVLRRYDHIDLDWQQLYDIPPFLINDSPAGFVYYLCKNNLRNYKKTGSNTIKKHYKIPKLKCQ